MTSNIYTRDEFCSVMSELENASITSSALRDIIRTSSSASGSDCLSDFFDPCVLFDGHTTSLIDVLTRMFSDDDNRWIEYWMYELDFGRQYEDGMIRSQDGADIPLRTASDLYSLLIEQRL